MGCRVYVSVPRGVPVTAGLWTPAPNVSVAPGAEEEPDEVLSSTSVTSGEEETVLVVMYVLTEFLCVLCVAVCATSVPGCVNGDNV